MTADVYVPLTFAHYKTRRSFFGGPRRSRKPFYKRWLVWGFAIGMLPGIVAAYEPAALLSFNNLSDVASAATSWTNLGGGTAGKKAASDNTKTTVASVSGTLVTGHIATFADTAGTVQDGGAVPAGTITSVTAGTNLTGGGSSGAITLALSTSLSDLSFGSSSNATLHPSSATAGLNNVGPGLSLINSGTGTGGFALTPATTGQEYIELDGVGTGNAPFFNLYAARGAIGSLTAIQSGDTVGNYTAAGYDGAAAGTAARVHTEATENWSSGHHGSAVQLDYVPTASATVTNALDCNKTNAGACTFNIPLYVLTKLGFGLASNASLIPSSAGTGLNNAGAGVTLTNTSAIGGLAMTPPSGSAGQEYMELDGVGTGNAPFFNLYAARGTVGSLTALQSGDTLGNFSNAGYDGTAAGAGTRVLAAATENWSVGHHGSSIELDAVAVGSATVTNHLDCNKTTAGTCTVNVPLVSAGIFTSQSGQVRKARVVIAAGAVTVATTDDIVIVNKTSGAATAVNLMSSPTTGTCLVVKDGKGDANTNPITVTPAAGNIDGTATFVMNQNYQSNQVCYNGTQWNVTL